MNFSVLLIHIEATFNYCHIFSLCVFFSIPCALFVLTGPFFSLSFFNLSPFRVAISEAIKYRCIACICKVCAENSSYRGSAANAANDRSNNFSGRSKALTDTQNEQKKHIAV